MKNRILALVFFFLNYLCIAQIEWIDGVAFGTNLSQGKNDTDNLGNTYSVGGFSIDLFMVLGPGQFYSNGELDAYIKKMDANGNFVWGRTFGGNRSDKANSISIDDQGNIFITGFFEDTIDLDPSPTNDFNVVSVGGQDVFIVKLTSDGDFIWGKTIGTTGDDEGLITEVNASGSCWISGSYSDTYIDLDPGLGIAGQGGFAAKGSFFVELNPQGDYLRGFVLNSINLTISGISPTENNGLYVSGHFIGPLDMDPGPATENISSLGPCTYCSLAFVLKVDSLGVMDWYQTLGEGPHYYSSKGGEVKVSENGNVFAYGQYTDSVTFYSGGNTTELFPAYVGTHGYLMKLSTDGLIDWVKSIDCADIKVGAMTIHGDEVVLTGEFTSKIDFDPSSAIVEMTTSFYSYMYHGFIASYDTLLGSFNWANTLPTEVNAYVKFVDIAYDDLGSFYGSGNIYHAVDFDPSSGEFIVNGANGNPFIVKYNNTLNVPISEDNAFSMEVFPNPVTDQLFISLKALQTYSIELIDQFGQCVRYIENATGNAGIDVSRLTKGIYILRVSNSKGSAIRKVVVN